MATIRKPKTAMKFSKPASWWGSTWREGLPIGNGVFGASVLGGAGNEVVMLNHGDLWWQGNAGVLPDVSDKIKEVKKQIELSNPKMAQDIVSSALIQKGYRPVPPVPLPLCDFKINMPLEKPVREYMRLLSMDDGEVTVSFKDGNTRYDRSCFVSRTSSLFAYEITKAGGKSIDATFSLELHDKTNVRTPTALSKLPEGIQTKYEKFFMYFSGRSDNGTEFGAVARISHFGGSMEVRTDGIRVVGAEKVLVLIKPYVESQREKEWAKLKAELGAVKLTYDKLLKEHTAVHSKLFNQVELDLDTPDRDLFMEELLDKSISADKISDTLLEKLWAYGRYLFISATSESSHIVAPYGLWCGDYKAVGSEVRSDGSLQNIYSHAFAGGYADFLLPIFTYYETVLDDLKKNAQRLYSCRGIFIPALTAPGSGLLGSVDSRIINFSGIAGWIGQLFYDYYLYTSDVKFLKERALPFMKEVALFYEEFFKVKTDGQYDTIPSYSPENSAVTVLEGTVQLDIARSSTVDFAIAKELLKNLIEGSIKAGANKNEIEKWKDMLTRIPEYKFNMDGTVREYLDNKFHDNYTTRHLAHLYPVYPGTEVYASDSDLHKAFALTAKKRLSTAIASHNTASFVKLANIYARLGDGASCMEAISYVVRTALMNNMITTTGDWRGMGIGAEDKWASYSIEGNMGITSAVQEMLLSSTDSCVKILPALFEEFKKGSVSGLCARQGITVDIDWDFKKASISVKIKSRKQVKTDIYLPPFTKKYKGPRAETFSSETCVIRDVELSNKVVTLDLKI